jgi:N-ethylmaleimide reductase
MPTAFDPIVLGGRELASRIVMAPMSRSRAYGPAATPGPSAARYYAQRAGAGLIISEGISPGPTGHGYPATPGLYTQAQVTAWRPVTDAVHAAGGVIFAQLMHGGRIGHPSMLPGGAVPLAPSPVRADTQVFTRTGPQPCVRPREMTAGDIARTIEEFAAAARNAVAAGFDGVEIHAGNGFLVHQFLAGNANTRTDEWGGSVRNRIRFAVEVTAAAAAAVGPDRVGVQVSPGNPYNDIAEQDGEVLYPALAAALSRPGLAYLSVAETGGTGLTPALRATWPGVLILNPHADQRAAGPGRLRLVEEGVADMVSFGVLFLANPDLPARLARGGPFNQPDPATFYGGGDAGYVDYPPLTDSGPAGSAPGVQGDVEQQVRPRIAG